MNNRQTEQRQRTFALSRDEAWTVHHVVLDRIEAEATMADREPPSIDVFRVFEKLESGTEQFTCTELRAMRSELDSYRSSERPSDRDDDHLVAIVERLDQQLAEC